MISHHLWTSIYQYFLWRLVFFVFTKDLYLSRVIKTFSFALEYVALGLAFNPYYTNFCVWFQEWYVRISSCFSSLCWKTLPFHLLIYLFIVKSAPLFLDYCSFRINAKSEIMSCPNFSSFYGTILVILDLFKISIVIFRISVSDFMLKSLLRFWLRLHGKEWTIS